MIDTKEKSKKEIITFFAMPRSNTLGSHSHTHITHSTTSERRKVEKCSQVRKPIYVPSFAS